MNPYEAPKARKKKTKDVNNSLLNASAGLGASALGVLALRHGFISNKESNMLKDVVKRDEEFGKGKASNTPQQAFDNYVRTGSTVLQNWSPFGMEPVDAMRLARSAPGLPESERWKEDSKWHYINSGKGPLYQAVQLVGESSDANTMEKPESELDQVLNYRLNLMKEGIKGRKEFDPSQFSDNISGDKAEVEKAQGHYRQTVEEARKYNPNVDAITDFKNFTSGIQQARDRFIAKNNLNEQSYGALPYEEQFKMYKAFEDDLSKTDPSLYGQYTIAKFANGTHYGMGANAYARKIFKPALQVRDALGYGAAMLGVGAVGVLGYMLYRKLKKKS
jgi:hypothetical protein